MLKLFNRILLSFLLLVCCCQSIRSQTSIDSSLIEGINMIPADHQAKLSQPVYKNALKLDLMSLIHLKTDFSLVYERAIERGKLVLSLKMHYPNDAQNLQKAERIKIDDTSFVDKVIFFIFFQSTLGSKPDINSFNYINVFTKRTSTFEINFKRRYYQGRNVYFTLQPGIGFQLNQIVYNESKFQGSQTKHFASSVGNPLWVGLNSYVYFTKGNQVITSEKINIFNWIPNLSASLEIELNRLPISIEIGANLGKVFSFSNGTSKYQKSYYFAPQLLVGYRF